MKTIPLGYNKEAIVDDVDFDYLSGFVWSFSNPYAARNVKHQKLRIWMHKEVMRLAGIEGKIGDHINRNPLDNRRANLRCATARQNVCNRRLQINNTTGFRGVTWQKRDGRFRAQIKNRGVVISLGWFADPVEAAKAYDKAALELNGDFAALNFPPVSHGVVDPGRTLTDEEMKPVRDSAWAEAARVVEQDKTLAAKHEVVAAIMRVVLSIRVSP